MDLKTLNSKERKQFYQKLEAQFGYTQRPDYAILFNATKKKYYFQDAIAATFDTKGFRVETIGLYVACELQSGEIRLTIEGSQLIGPHATKQILLIDDHQHALWIRGNDLDLTGDEEGWMIIAHKHPLGMMDYEGSGKVVIKEEAGKTIKLLHNYIPKARYVRSEIEYSIS